MTSSPGARAPESSLPQDVLLAIVERLNVAIFIFDRGFTLREMNAAGRRLVGSDARAMVGVHAAQLNLRVGLGGVRTIEMPLVGGDAGQHVLLAWKPDATNSAEGLGNVIRVFVHEANNSLMPIASLASTVQQIASRAMPPSAEAEDAIHALAVIEARALALGRFLRACLDFADLPVTTAAKFALRPLIDRVAALETRLRVVVDPGEEVELFGVRDEIEQVVINLVRNAVDASLGTGGIVRIAWTIDRGMIDLRILDDGTGDIDDDPLFAPRRTTKPGGLGIGLAISRYVAANHGGSLQLRRRTDANGCEAVLRLAMTAPLR